MGAMGAVWVNALWFQEGRHPAPLFATSRTDAGPVTASLPKLQVIEPDRPLANLPESDRAAIIAELQRGLLMLGFYDGPVDGTSGPRTGAAVAAYQKAHGLPASDGEADYRLLQHVRLTSRDVTPLPPPPPLSTPDRQISAVQQVLAELGYAPGKVDGRLGEGTRSAIERFERDRGLPVTGAISPALLRELTRVSGTPLDARPSG